MKTLLFMCCLVLAGCVASPSGHGHPGLILPGTTKTILYQEFGAPKAILKIDDGSQILFYQSGEHEYIYVVTPNGIIEKIIHRMRSASAPIEKAV